MGTSGAPPSSHLDRVEPVHVDSSKATEDERMKSSYEFKYDVWIVTTQVLYDIDIPAASTISLEGPW